MFSYFFKLLIYYLVHFNCHWKYTSSSIRHLCIFIKKIIMNGVKINSSASVPPGRCVNNINSKWKMKTTSCIIKICVFVFQLCFTFRSPETFLFTSAQMNDLTLSVGSSYIYTLRISTSHYPQPHYRSTHHHHHNIIIYEVWCAHKPAAQTAGEFDVYKWSVEKICDLF